MSSETDQPRQRTVAELLAENGGGSASGRRRRRREADDAGAEAAGGPPAAEGPGVPGRHGGTQAWRAEPAPEAPAAPAEPWRTAQPAGSAWERGRQGGPRLERDAEEESGDDRGTGFGPGARPNGAAPGGFAPRGFGRPDDDAPQNGFARPGAGPNGFGPGQAGPQRPGQNGFGPAGQDAQNGFGRGAPSQNGAPQNGAPTGLGQPRTWQNANQNGPGQNGPGQSGASVQDRPGPPAAAANEPDFGRAPHRPDPPAQGGWAANTASAGTVGLPTEAGRTGAPERSPWAPNGRPGRPGEPGTEQLGRVRAPQDEPLTAPFGSVYGGPPIQLGGRPVHDDEDAGPPTQFGAPPLHDEDDDDAGPPTQLGAPALDDEDDDDTYHAPAGLGRRAPVEPDEEDEEEGEGTPQGWAVVIGQWIAGALVGAAVWVGFRYLWFNLPVVALAAAVIITVGLVLGVRALLRNDDLRTTAFAVGVGLLLTVSPAILVLLER
ncbi:hypothetical protein GCM10010472_50210 [Pseudonocardia halophobica]|uniref:Uncharacterized protein n=1 Tax=Pseudonocardia halophobica TaxID=29401 RepID=A0A9W6LB35_9PSEU|nr:Yip1 family protein [Pseudonocardia halophobica]GLL15034.1 hypothetical protein GCM10017577_61830 [Pseudonocardia halophobica]